MVAADGEIVGELVVAGEIAIDGEADDVNAFGDVDISDMTFFFR